MEACVKVGSFGVVRRHVGAGVSLHLVVLGASASVRVTVMVMMVGVSPPL